MTTVPGSTLLVAGFALSVLGLGWHYAGYPLVLAAISRWRGSVHEPVEWADAEEMPPITIVVIAHNEADAIEERIENCFAADYPTEKIRVLVASDGSTDETVERARAVGPRVDAFDDTPRNKSRTRNRAVDLAETDIVLFTDADTRFEPDCVRHLVGHLADPAVGAVCGALRSESFEEGAIGTGMGIYWRWEYWLRRLQSRLGLLVKSTGANMGLRTEVFEPIPETLDIDQAAGFMAIQHGRKSLFVRDAVATEEFPTTVVDEFETRRRLTVRGLTALRHYARVYLMRPWLAIHTTSYWLLRYLVPVFLLGVLLSTAALALHSRLFAGLFAIQALLYILAITGYFAERRDAASPIFGIPFSYCWANAGVLAGSVSFLGGTRIYSYDTDK